MSGLLFFILMLLASLIRCQDDGGEEGGQEQDMNDPSLVMGEDGGGGGLNNGETAGTAVSMTPAHLETLKLQTLTALQELGVVIGVGFLVGVIFFLMVFTEKLVIGIIVKCQKRFGHKVPDVEDPAALVGTYKRCRNL